VHLILGGFHLLEASISAIEATIEELIGLGVEWVSACHYSGATPKGYFKSTSGKTISMAEMIAFNGRL